MKKLFLLLLYVFTNYAFSFQQDLSEKIRQADSLLNEKAYHLSKDHWKEILELAPKNNAGYNTYKSKLFFCEAKLLEADGDYKNATEKYQLVQELLNKDSAPKDPQYEVIIYSGLYHSLAYSGNWQAALEKGNEGFALLNSTIDKKIRTDYVYDLGYINDRLNNYPEAIDLYQQSIALYKTFEENKSFDLGLAYNNLATVYRKIGFFSERLNSFEQAKIYWEKDSSINPTYLITLYGNMMRLYIEYGDATKAEQLFNALNEVPKEGLPTPDVFDKFRLNVMYYTFSGQLEKAESQLGEFSTLFSVLSQKEKEQNNHFYLATLLEMTDYYYEKELDDQALETSIRTINIAKTYRQSYYEMRAYTQQTKLATHKKEYAAAVDLLDKALAINDLKPIGLVNVVNILIKKGTVQAKQNHITEARKSIKDALTVLADKKVNAPEEITIETFEQQHSSYFVIALKDLAGFYKEMFHHTKQKTDAQHAKYLYEMAADVFGLYYQNGEYNSYLNKLNKEINEGIYEIHTESQTPLSPVIVTKIEANTSQVLRNEFERKYFQFLSVEEGMLAQRNLLQFQLKNTKKDNETDKTLTELQKEITKLDTEIATKDPLLQSFYNDDISLQEIQNHLTENELFVKYFVGEQYVFASILSQNNIELYRLAETDSLKEKLTIFYKNLQNPQINTLSQSQELYTQLIKPFQEKLEKYKFLTIVPDDFLHYLPFETLENEAGPLVSLHNIKYANSLALWHFLKINPHQPKEDQNLLAAFAPQYNIKSNEIALRGNRFKDLKGARTEAENITSSMKGDLFLNDEASIENFVTRTSAYKIYHLAMHAVLNEEDHTKSSLIFHNNDFFDFSSLYGMYLPADLVVLSACNTGIGKLAAGEGFLSLSRALTYSGVRSSVYSLWEVPDEETSELMVSFYNYLSEGKNKADALSEAKKDFIENNPLKSHPYYWAGFVLNGDATPIVTAGKNTFWYITAGVIFIAGLFLFKRYRRKRSV